MSEGFAIARMPGFLQVTVEPVASHPVASPEAVERFFARIAGEARAAGVARVLVDARAVRGGLDTLERFTYGSALVGPLRGLRVAFVAHVPLRDPERFGQTVAENRGADVRVFEEPGAARAWLEAAS